MRRFLLLPGKLLASNQSDRRGEQPAYIGGLRAHYRSVGQALVSFERRVHPFNIRRSGIRSATREFQIEVSFVPTEVLEHYLDDLLEPQTSDSDLYIDRSTIKLSLGSFACLAFLFCVLGFIAAKLATSYPLIAAFLGTVLIIGWIGFFLSEMRAMRRMRFATLLSREISRRRGDGTRVYTESEQMPPSDPLQAM